MNKELSKEEILANWGIFDSNESFNNANEAMQQFADQQAKKEAIDAMDWIRKQRPDIFYGSPTSEQLYKLFKEEK